MRRAAGVVCVVAVMWFVPGCKDKPSGSKAAPPAAPAAETPEQVELVHPQRVMTAFGGVCYLAGDGAIKCVDSYDHCISPPPKGAFASISGTEAYACALDATGKLTCWGDGTEQKPPIERAVQVSVQKPHSCALGLDGKVSCWGRDYEGSLAVPDGTFTQVAVGHSHTCALRADETVTCWGWNTSGQTDAPGGKFTTLSAGTQLSCGIRPTGELACWGMDTKVPPGQFTDVSADGFRNCALRKDGVLVCWGSGWGDGKELDGGPFVALAESCGVTAGGELTCFRVDGTQHGDDGTTRYADASGSCGPPAAPAEVPTGPAPRRPWIDEAMKLVKSHDSGALSDARDLVEKGDVRAFVEEYAKLTDWDDKEALVFLIQDQNDPALTPVMQDFLFHPDCDYEPCSWSRAVALSQLDGNAENFSKYFDDPAAAKKKVAEWQAKLRK